MIYLHTYLIKLAALPETKGDWKENIFLSWRGNKKIINNFFQKTLKDKLKCFALVSVSKHGYVKV